MSATRYGEAASIRVTEICVRNSERFHNTNQNSSGRSCKVDINVHLIYVRETG